MSKKTIYILGDICPRWEESNAFDSGNENSVFNEIINLLSDADFVIANLEAPATSTKNKLKKNSINLRTEVSDLELLKKAGINGLSLANNHILDYGIKGLEDTFKACEKYNLFYYGAGDIFQAAEPFYIQLENKKIGILAFAEHEFNSAVDYGKGANLWDDLSSIATIKKAKENCDYLIVQYHGGIEDYIYPSPYLQKKCRFMCDAGADFVTCQHSHCIGTKETYNNSEILYGQGNTIFGFEENNPLWNQGLIVKITLADIVNITYIPITSSYEGERLLGQDESEEILKKFTENSQNISNAKFIHEKWNEFCESKKNHYLPMLFSWNRLFNKLNRIFTGKPIDFLTTKNARMNSMNLIRCDAHREVLKTILENNFNH